VGGALRWVPASHQELDDSVGHTSYSLDKFQKHHACVAFGADLVYLGRHRNSKDGVDLTHAKVVIDNLGGGDEIYKFLKGHETFFTAKGFPT
jgi:hypothetical protein